MCCAMSYDETASPPFFPFSSRVFCDLTCLQGRRPLIPPDMPMSADVREVFDTCRTVARLGAGCLGAYVISMAKRASDVLAVELLQREANFQVGLYACVLSVLVCVPVCMPVCLPVPVRA